MENAAQAAVAVPVDAPAVTEVGLAPATQTGAEPVVDGGQGEPNADPPAPQHTAPDPLEAVRAFTGGAVQSEADWKTFQAAKSSLEEATARLAALEGEKAGWTEIGQKVNQMVADGEPLEKVVRFMEVQKLDLDNMDPLSLIKAKEMSDYPFLTAEELDAHLEDKGLISHDEAPSAALSAKQKVAAAEAKQHLASLRVSLGTSQAAERREAVQRSESERLQAWQPTFQSPLQDLRKTLAVPDGTFDHPLSKEAVSAGKQAAEAWARQAGVAPNEQNLQTFREIAVSMATLHDLDAIVRGVAENAFQRGVAKAKSEVAGPAPAAPQVGVAPGAPAKSSLPGRFSD